MRGRLTTVIVSLLAWSCAHVESDAIPSGDRYTYRLEKRTVQIDESELARLQDSWMSVSEAAKRSRVNAVDRVRALNNLALLEERRFSCSKLQTLEISQRRSGFLGLGFSHGFLHRLPSIEEEWKVRACDKYHWYLVYGDEGSIDVHYWQ
jgi:hypothetical protein